MPTLCERLVRHSLTRPCSSPPRFFLSFLEVLLLLQKRRPYSSFPFFFTALICLTASITISRETTLSIFARKTSGHRTYVRRNRSSPLFTLLFLPFHRGTTLPSPVDAKLPLTGSLAPNEITSSVRGEKTPGFGETIERSLHLQRRLTVSGKFDLKGGQTNRARYDTFSVVERGGSNFPRGRTRVTNKRGKLS